MPWTDEMVEELKRLWAEGVTTGEIGRRLNISKNSIVGKVHRLGLSGRPSPIKRKNETDNSKPAAKKEAAPKEKKCCKQKEAPKKEPKAEEKAAPKAQKPEAPTKPEVKAEEAPIKKPAPAKASISQDDEDIKLAKSMNITSDTPAHKGHFSLTDLDNHTCRWPIGDPKDENFHFCGKKVRIGQTYCEEHAAIAYVRNNKK